MYSSCLACHASHAGNSALPQFSVGDCIAYAPEVGRLWVVCRACGEWNLAPVEERWEAVKACEELYQSSVERGAIRGLAKAHVGDLVLLRVGTTEEIPTLRYGSRLRQRSRRDALRVGFTEAVEIGTVVVAVGVGALVGGDAGLAIAFVGLALALAMADKRREPVVAAIPTDTGDWVELRAHQLQDVRLASEADGGWSLLVRRGVELRGATAVEAVRLLMPLLNRAADLHLELERALRYIEEREGTVASVFSAASRRRGQNRRARLAKLEPCIRLALEILAAREVEDRAIAGDLEPLRLAWKHAEELAAIEDDLTFTLDVLEPLHSAEADDRLKSGAS